MVVVVVYEMPQKPLNALGLAPRKHPLFPDPADLAFIVHDWSDCNSRPNFGATKRCTQRLLARYRPPASKTRPNRTFRLYFSSRPVKTAGHERGETAANTANTSQKRRENAEEHFLDEKSFIAEYVGR